MTEICSITFTSPENCDVINAACAILAMDPELADCKVVMTSDHEKNKVSITGSWRAISQLRKQLMAVFCTATEKQQPLVGDAVKSFVDSVLRGESTQEGKEAKDAENVTSTANATQKTRNVPPSKRELQNCIYFSHMHITWTVYAPTLCQVFTLPYMILCTFKMISLVNSVFFLSHVHLTYVYTVFHPEWQIFTLCM